MLKKSYFCDLLIVKKEFLAVRIRVSYNIAHVHKRANKAFDVM